MVHHRHAHSNGSYRDDAQRIQDFEPTSYVNMSLSPQVFTVLCM
jgi:hypothetical protein